MDYSYLFKTLMVNEQFWFSILTLLGLIFGELLLIGIALYFMSFTFRLKMNWFWHKHHTLSPDYKTLSRAIKKMKIKVKENEITITIDKKYVKPAHLEDFDKFVLKLPEILLLFLHIDVHDTPKQYNSSISTFKAKRKDN